MGTKTERKYLIFSNFEAGANCYEGCNQDEYCDCDSVTLQDERMNLDTAVDGRILAIADLGLWNGRRKGYSILTDNIASIFNMSFDYGEWYSDGRNIKARIAHHDGTNYIEYRVIREDRNIEALLRKIYNGEPVTRQQINYYTKSLHPYIARRYGWR